MLEDLLYRSVFYLAITILILSLWMWLNRRFPNINMSFVVFLFFYRLLFILIYLNYIPGDWIEYLEIIKSEREVPFVLGNGEAGVKWFGSLFRFMHLGYFEYFLLYSLFGYLGTVLFYLMIHRLCYYKDKIKVGRINVFPWILLYPSLHMYTCMVGKDPIIFFGIALSSFALIGKRISWFLMVIGLLSMILVRPHMAVIYIISLGLTLLISKEWNFIKKTFLALIGSLVAIIIIPKLISLFRIDNLSLEAVQMAIELNEGYVSNAGTYVDMTTYPLLLKVFTYLFRPLFLDSPNVLLLEYSAENLFFLVLLIMNLRFYFFSWLRKQNLIIKFSFVYFVVGVLVLSNGLSVYGLFIRQKTMIFLNFLLLLFSFIYFRQNPKITVGR